jgi:hypothetical protein
LSCANDGAALSAAMLNPTNNVMPPVAFFI